MNPDQRLKRKYVLEKQLDGIIIKLEELLNLQSLNYEPYHEKQTKAAIKALLNIRGIPNIKALHKRSGIN